MGPDSGELIQQEQKSYFDYFLQLLWKLNTGLSSSHLRLRRFNYEVLQVIKP